MKNFAILLIFIMGKSVGATLDISMSPIETSIVSFCNENGSCKTVINIQNKTPYEAMLASDLFDKSSISTCSLSAYLADEYAKAAANFKNPTRFKLKTKCPSKEKLIDLVTIEPNGTRQYVVDELDTIFEMAPETDYLLKFYAPMVDIYISQMFIGAFSLESNFGLLSKSRTKRL